MNTVNISSKCRDHIQKTEKVKTLLSLHNKHLKAQNFKCIICLHVYIQTTELPTTDFFRLVLFPCLNFLSNLRDHSKAQ